MLLTEEQARTKWCPHVVASHTDPRGGFRGTDWDAHNTPTHPCIASECMAWRWARNPSVTLNCEEEAEFGARYHTDGWVRRELPNGFFQYTPNNGFCGLAGKVES